MSNVKSDPLSVQCPHCGAAPGVPCTDTYRVRGRRLKRDTPRPHLARRREAELADAAFAEAPDAAARDRYYASQRRRHGTAERIAASMRAAASSGELPPTAGPPVELDAEGSKPLPSESESHPRAEHFGQRLLLTFEAWQRTLPSMLQAAGLAEGFTGVVVPNPNAPTSRLSLWYVTRTGAAVPGRRLMVALLEVMPLIEATNPLAGPWAMGIAGGSLQVLYEYQRPPEAPHLSKHWNRLLPSNELRVH